MRQDFGKEVTNLCASGAFSLLTRPSSVFLIPDDGTLKSYRGFCHSSFGECCLEKPLSKLGMNLWLYWTTLPVLNPTAIKKPLPWSTDNNSNSGSLINLNSFLSLFVWALWEIPFSEKIRRKKTKKYKIESRYSHSPDIWSHFFLKHGM